MKRMTNRKLELNRETIRALTSLEMQDVAGGKGAKPLPKPTMSGCGCTIRCITPATLLCHKF
jgi:hypothetical protein